MLPLHNGVQMELLRSDDPDSEVPAPQHAESKAQEAAEEELDDGVGFDLTPQHMRTKWGRCGDRTKRCIFFTSTCCCLPCCRDRIASSSILLTLYFLLLFIVSISLLLGFLHVWYMFSDVAEEGCLRSTTSMANFRSVLQRFEEVANKHNIEYWIDYGVLLGGMQRGDILPWDRDIVTQHTHTQSTEREHSGNSDAINTAIFTLHSPVLLSSVSCVRISVC